MLTVLVAELIAHHFPKMIELHSYVPASGVALKMHNWELLNRKVFPKLGIRLPVGTIDAICQARQGYVEQVVQSLSIDYQRVNLIIHPQILRQIKKLIAKKSEEDEIEKRGGGGDAAEVVLPEVLCLAHFLPNGNADHVIFQGVKFVPEKLVVELELEREEMKGKIRELSHKVVDNLTLFC